MSHSRSCNFFWPAAFKYIETVGQWLRLQRQPLQTTGGFIMRYMKHLALVATLAMPLAYSQAQVDAGVSAGNDPGYQDRDRDNRIRARPIKARNIQIKTRNTKVRPIRGHRLRLGPTQVIPTGIMPIKTTLIATTTTMRTSACLQCARMVITRTTHTPAHLTAFTARGGL